MLTNLYSFFHKKRLHTLDNAYHTSAAELQRRVLKSLIHRARHTEYGVMHHFDAIDSYADFAEQVPVNGYDDLKEQIDRMRHGEADILWPGRVKWYAKSSGTTNDKSKFIPVTPDGLKNIHYRGGHDCATLYFDRNPQSKMLSGKGLILGGSHAANYNLKHSLVGDLSAILIENISTALNIMRVPKKKVALLSDFEKKRELIAQQTLSANVTNLSGVPSWMMSVLLKVLEESGKTSIAEVWPNLEVFFHGGIAFGPYRAHYERLIG